MRYFKVISSGKILCTFKRCEWMRHEVVYRCKNVFTEFPEHDPGFACSPSPEVPSERDYCQMVEISESEALEADPGLFKDGFQDYEEMKRMEPRPEQAPAKKRKAGTTQATLF